MPTLRPGASASRPLPPLAPWRAGPRAAGGAATSPAAPTFETAASQIVQKALGYVTQPQGAEEAVRQGSAAKLVDPASLLDKVRARGCVPRPASLSAGARRC